MYSFVNNKIIQENSCYPNLLNIDILFFIYNSLLFISINKIYDDCKIYIIIKITKSTYPLSIYLHFHVSVFIWNRRCYQLITSKTFFLVILNENKASNWVITNHTEYEVHGYVNFFCFPSHTKSWTINYKVEWIGRAYKFTWVSH